MTNRCEEMRSQFSSDCEMVAAMCDTVFATRADATAMARDVTEFNSVVCNVSRNKRGWVVDVERPSFTRA